MNGVFLQSWEALARSFVLLAGSYAGLILFLRISGKRTLSKMNAFDLVVTVSLGSTLATISLSKDVALLQGLLVLTLLILLQFAVAWLSVRWPFFQQLVKSEPRLLFHQGVFQEEALKGERVTRDEVLAAIRSQGHADLSKVLAVVLETDGSFSVIAKVGNIEDSSLQNLRAAQKGEIGSNTNTRGRSG